MAKVKSLKPAKEGAIAGDDAGSQPKVSSKNIGKVASSSFGKKDKKKKKRNVESYSYFIYKVLKQVHPEVGVNSKAMSVLNSFVKDIFERIALEASGLTKHSKKITLSSHEIQTAVRLILPGELAKHAGKFFTSSLFNFFY